jgi:hypothetical protein
MSKQATLIDELKHPRATQGDPRALRQVSDQPHEVSLNTQPAKSDQKEHRTAVILRHPAAQEPSPIAQYLDQSVDLETLSIPFVRFAGTKRILPEREAECPGWSAFLQEIAPDPAPVIKHKDQVPYYIAGILKEAELINEKLRQQRLSKGESTVGKQRSSAHIKTLGPAVFMDDDGDVLAREPALRAFGVAAGIYTSHSFGFQKGDATVPAQGGRVVTVLNRSVTVDEYGSIWDALNHLLGGGFDEHGRSPALCYGRHARRNDQATYRRLMIQGAALDADKLIELGRTLRPARTPSRVALDQSTAGGRNRAFAEEIERTRLMGAVRRPDDYGEWVSGAAAFKRAFPNDTEAAFECFDAWSACSTKYEGKEATRGKFEQVPADYQGIAAPVTLEMLHWRTRRRAESVIFAQYSPAAQWPKPSGLHVEDFESAAAGITLPKGSEPISSNSLKPEDAIVALDYLLSCWSPKAYEQIIAGLTVPQSAIEEARRRSEHRREKIDLAGRTLHKWEGQNLAADTAALSDAIIASKPDLYRVDQTLVWISEPSSDAATAQRVREIHRYNGAPGAPGDPARHTCERLVPILPSDAEGLREIIAEHVATKRRINDGTKAKPIWREEIASFPFKPSTALHVGPDAAVLKDLLKRELPTRVPEVSGVITAPVMSCLPASTNPDELLKHGADHIIANPGFDSASGLFLSPQGAIIDVPDAPTKDQVGEAADMLLTPWHDFPFAPFGDGLSADVSRSAAVYAMMIAANRRALPIAPGIGFSSHGEGMSSGKTLAGEIIGIIATGDRPVPVSLSTNFSEQRKEIMSFYLEGDGSLFVDNIQTGTRFDSAALASSMTSPRFRDRLLGTNKQMEVGTQVMVIATGNSLNMAGDLASRFLTVRLNTGLERPEDRSSDGFKIPDLSRWVVEHRQRLVAAVHVIVRGYLRECKKFGGTPPEVTARRQVVGTRFGGQCEVLRDALLWALPDLPDPFLSFQASALNSSTKIENALLLGVLDGVLTMMAGRKYAPAWTSESCYSGEQKSSERLGWEKRFRARWERMAPEQRRRRYAAAIFGDAENHAWRRLQARAQRKWGHLALRAGQARFTSSEIVAEISTSTIRPSSEYLTLEGVMPGKRLNPVSLGRLLKERLVDAPTNGLVLRSAQGRRNCAEFWITRGM